MIVGLAVIVGLIRSGESLTMLILSRCIPVSGTINAAFCSNAKGL